MFYGWPRTKGVNTNLYTPISRSPKPWPFIHISLLIWQRIEVNTRFKTQKQELVCSSGVKIYVNHFPAPVTNKVKCIFNDRNTWHAFELINSNQAKNIIVAKIISHESRHQICDEIFGVIWALLIKKINRILPWAFLRGDEGAFVDMLHHRPGGRSAKILAAGSSVFQTNSFLREYCKFSTMITAIEGAAHMIISSNHRRKISLILHPKKRQKNYPRVCLSSHDAVIIFKSRLRKDGAGKHAKIKIIFSQITSLEERFPQ